jgi:hypothetical protein
VFENTQESITSHSTSNEIASSTPGASYESENESSTASPAAPSATFDYVTEISTSPPSEEPVNRYLVFFTQIYSHLRDMI